MSCGKKFDSGSCVCDILREIADAQQDILADCDVSCENSINELLGEARPTPSKDTVPVLLYCDGNCEPFKGFAVKDNHDKDVVASFFFRVKEVFDDCCAVLELLRAPGEEADPKSPTKQSAKELRRTGLCITVDLKCFCHVTCLPAINAIP